MRRLHITRFGVGAILFLAALLDLWHLVHLGDGVIIWRAGVSVMLVDIALCRKAPPRTDLESGWLTHLPVAALRPEPLEA